MKYRQGFSPWPHRVVLYVNGLAVEFERHQLSDPIRIDGHTYFEIKPA